MRGSDSSSVVTSMGTIRHWSWTQDESLNSNSTNPIKGVSLSVAVLSTISCSSSSSWTGLITRCGRCLRNHDFEIRLTIAPVSYKPLHLILSIEQFTRHFSPINFTNFLWEDGSKWELKLRSLETLICANFWMLLHIILWLPQSFFWHSLLQYLTALQFVQHLKNFASLDFPQKLHLQQLGFSWPTSCPSWVDPTSFLDPWA